MSLRIPLTKDQTLQVEFHEIERRLRRLERTVGVVSNSTIIKVAGSGGGASGGIDALIERLEALELAVAGLVPPEEMQDFGAVGQTAARGLVPDPGIAEPPEGVAQHVLTEDNKWGFPFRGLVQVVTPGVVNGYATNALNVLGSLAINGYLTAYEMQAHDSVFTGDQLVNGLITGGTNLWLKANTSTISLGASRDVYLYRDAANVLAQKNGTSGQIFRIYETTTNSQRFTIECTSTAYVSMGTEGSGSARRLEMRVGGANRFVFDLDCFHPVDDATYDNGKSTLRWRSLYLGGVAASVPATIKLHASQSANAAEIQNSSGTVLSRIKSDGRWRHDGATTWDDLRIEPVARTTGAGAPAFEKWFDDTPGTSVGVFLYSFTDESVLGNEKQVFFSMQMPHQWKLGTNIHLHVHWVSAANVNNAVVNWGLEYAWKDIGATYGDTTIVYATTHNITGDGSTDTNVVAGKHYIDEFDALVPGATADNVSSILIGRLFRHTSDAADTLTDKVGLLYIDAHYEIDSFGSDTEYTK